MQSLDVFVPEQSPREVETVKQLEKGKRKKYDFLQQKEWPKLLLGTRNGDIIESSFTLDLKVLLQQNQTTQNRGNLQQQQQQPTMTSQQTQLQQGLNPRASNDNENSGDEESSDEEEQQKIVAELWGQSESGFRFLHQDYLRFHQAQNTGMSGIKSLYENLYNKKVYFALHPRDNILVTVGEDNNLFMHSLDQNELLAVLNFERTPTALRFSPNGEILIIGFQNGDLNVYESRSSLQKPKKEALTGSQKNRKDMTTSGRRQPSLRFLSNLNEKVKPDPRGNPPSRIILVIFPPPTLSQ